MNFGLAGKARTSADASCALFLTVPTRQQGVAASHPRRWPWQVLAIAVPAARLVTARLRGCWLRYGSYSGGAWER